MIKFFERQFFIENQILSKKIDSQHFSQVSKNEAKSYFYRNGCLWKCNFWQIVDFCNTTVTKSTENVIVYKCVCLTEPNRNFGFPFYKNQAQPVPLSEERKILLFRFVVTLVPGYSGKVTSVSGISGKVTLVFGNSSNVVSFWLVRLRLFSSRLLQCLVLLISGNSCRVMFISNSVKVTLVGWLEGFSGTKDKFSGPFQVDACAHRRTKDEIMDINNICSKFGLQLLYSKLVITFEAPI